VPTLYGPDWALKLLADGALVDQREATLNQRKADLALGSSMPKAPVSQAETDRRIDQALAMAPPLPPEPTFGGPVTPDPAARPAPTTPAEAAADVALASTPPVPPEPALPEPPAPEIGPDGYLRPPGLAEMMARPA
jgi:hypothetical protein